MIIDLPRARAELAEAQRQERIQAGTGAQAPRRRQRNVRKNSAFSQPNAPLT